MSKIRSAQNKELYIALGLSAIAIFWVLVNLIIIIPGVSVIAKPKSPSTNTDPIDTAAVNEAIQILNEK